MTPIRLTLRHYCQHTALELLFAQGMNLISGVNGSGKSNALDALRLCLALESGNPGKLTDNIQDGHDQGSLVLDFQHQDTPGSITIRLKRNYLKNWDELSLEQEAARAQVRAREQDASIEVKDSWLKLATLNPKEQMLVALVHAGQTLTKVGEVREWIRNNIGLDPKVLSESYFPRQGDVDGALSGDLETRQRVFHDKAGTAMCQKLWDELGKEIRSLPDFSAVQDLEQELAVKEARARAAHLEYAEKAEQARARAPVVAGLQDLLDRARISVEEQKRQLEMQERRSDLAHQQRQHALAGEKLLQEGQTLAAQVQAQQPELTALRASLAEQAALLLQQEARRALAGRVKAAAQELSRYDPLSRPNPYPEGYADLVVAAGSAADAVQRAEFFIEHFGSGVCPTCEQEVKDARGRVEILQAGLGAMRALVISTAQAVKQAAQASREYEQWFTLETSRLSSATATHQGLEAQLQALPEPTGILSPAELSRSREALGRLEADEARLQRLREQYLASQEQLRGLGIRLQELDAQLARSTSAIGDLPPLEQVQEAQRLLSARVAADQEIRELETETEVRLRYLTDVQRDLDAARARVRQAEPMARWLTMLEQVRDLLHRDALPAEVVAWYAGQLVHHTLTYLKMFEAEFELFVARDLTLMASFADKTLPVSRLSGGQKNMLNISMRLAMIDMFPSELRLLVLDEVEVHLDQRNVARLPIVLERVKGLARGRELVVLFISHHPSLGGIADHVIHI